MAFKYLRLAAELQAAISEGTFADKLPTEQTLCDAYQVSRQTVRQALEHLVELGLIENLCPVPITSLTHDTQKMGGLAAQFLWTRWRESPFSPLPFRGSWSRKQAADSITSQSRMLRSCFPLRRML